MSSDESYMAFARSIAEDSKCPRLKVGAVIVKNGKIISYGYNRVPKNLRECSIENPCYKIENNIASGTIVDVNRCMSVHAEVFAIINAGNREFSSCQSKENLSGSTLFTTYQPCRNCALFIVAADIRRVVYENPYPDDVSLDFFQVAKIKVERLESVQKKSMPIASMIFSKEVEVYA